MRIGLMSASVISLANDVAHEERNHYGLFSESRYEDPRDRFGDDHDRVRQIEILSNTPNTLLNPPGNNG